MKMEIKNILYLLTLIEMTFSINGLFTANEEYKAVKKRIKTAVIEEITLDPKLAYMSSQHEDKNAGLAVSDTCSKDNTWLYASSTEKQEKPSWAIDLQKFHYVERVDMTTANYNKNYKPDYDIFSCILDDKPILDKIEFGPKCVSFKAESLTSLQKIVFQIGKLGRFASITLLGERSLQICHVSIYGISYSEVPMVAKEAWQTSTVVYGEAEYLVSTPCRKSNKMYYASSTNREQTPAWALDLKVNFKIEFAVITARYDQDWKDFHDAYTCLTYEKPNLANIDSTNYCAYFKGPAKQYQNIIFECKSTGRYFIIALNIKKTNPTRNNRIQLCELAIYALKANGEWRWSDWSTCSKSCGVGERRRSRECDNPPPQFGGSACSGSKSETGKCEMKPCPIVDIITPAIMDIKPPLNDYQHLEFFCKIYFEKDEQFKVNKIKWKFQNTPNSAVTDLPPGCSVRNNPRMRVSILTIHQFTQNHFGQYYCIFDNRRHYPKVVIKGATDLTKNIVYGGRDNCLGWNSVCQFEGDCCPGYECQGGYCVTGDDDDF